MVTLLFWNTCRNDVASTIADLASTHQVDILILAECDMSPPQMLTELNQVKKLDFRVNPSQCERIWVFSRYSSKYIKPIHESEYLTIRHIQLPTTEEFLLAGVHLPSKLYQEPDSQILECSDLSGDIRRVEESVGIQKTLLVGDLNMNPFEPGIVGANGLHGVMAREVALKGSRRVAGKDYPFFYNPMWSFFGDLNEGPAGTYYFDRAEHVTYFWNIFDQVLVRPALLPYFDCKSLRILVGDERVRLLDNRGLPDKVRASDHLPILFRLNL